MTKPAFNVVGTVTYRCSTCGELISDDSELLWVDEKYVGTQPPSQLSSTTTTHHLGCVVTINKKED